MATIFCPHFTQFKVFMRWLGSRCLLMHRAWGNVTQFPFSKILNGALLPGSSALPQTPDYHPSAQNTEVSALSLTRLQQFGTNSVCLSFYLCQFFQIEIFLKNLSLFKNLFFRAIALRYKRECVWGVGCVHACWMCVCMCAKFSHSCLNNVICVGVDSTFELYVKLRRILLLMYICVLLCLHCSVL